MTFNFPTTTHTFGTNREEWAKSYHFYKLQLASHHPNMACIARCNMRMMVRKIVGFRGDEVTDSLKVSSRVLLAQ